jgi:hypothetical protein
MADDESKFVEDGLAGYAAQGAAAQTDGSKAKGEAKGEAKCEANGPEAKGSKADGVEEAAEKKKKKKKKKKKRREEDQPVSAEEQQVAMSQQLDAPEDSRRRSSDGESRRPLRLSQAMNQNKQTEPAEPKRPTTPTSELKEPVAPASTPKASYKGMSKKGKLNSQQLAEILGESLGPTMEDVADDPNRWSTTSHETKSAWGGLSEAEFESLMLIVQPWQGMPVLRNFLRDRSVTSIQFAELLGAVKSESYSELVDAAQLFYEHLIDAELLQAELVQVLSRKEFSNILFRLDLQQEHNLDFPDGWFPGGVTGTEGFESDFSDSDEERDEADPELAAQHMQDLDAEIIAVKQQRAAGQGGYVPTEARILESLQQMDSRFEEVGKTSGGMGVEIDDSELMLVPSFIARRSGCSMCGSALLALLLGVAVVFPTYHELSVQFNTDNYKVEGESTTVGWDRWNAAKESSYTNIMFAQSFGYSGRRTTDTQQQEEQQQQKEEEGGTFLDSMGWHAEVVDSIVDDSGGDLTLEWAHELSGRGLKEQQEEVEGGAAALGDKVLNAGEKDQGRVMGRQQRALMSSSSKIAHCLASNDGKGRGSSLNSCYGGKITLVYEVAGSEDGNILTPELLRSAMFVERAIRRDMDSGSMCWRANGKCIPPDSALNWFYPSVREVEEGEDAGNGYAFDGEGDKMANVRNMAQYLVSKGKVGIFDKNFGERYEKNGQLHSRLLKTEVPFGLPLKGFQSVFDRPFTQKQRMKKFGRKIVGKIKNFLRASGGAGKMYILYEAPGSLYSQYTGALMRDLPLVVVSILFLLCYMAMYNGSFYLACMGLVTIILSFPVTVFVYRVVLGIKFLGVMNFVSVWIVLGIGADDIFVFTDTWKQSKTLQVDGRRAPLAHRLSWTVREAGFSMLITTTTTSAAFFGSAISRIEAIQHFGLFMGIITIANYLLCLSFYAAAVVQGRRTKWTKMVCCRRCCKVTARQVARTKAREEEEEAFRKRRLGYHRSSSVDEKEREKNMLANLNDDDSDEDLPEEDVRDEDEDEEGCQKKAPLRHGTLDDRLRRGKGNPASAKYEAREAPESNALMSALDEEQNSGGDGIEKAEETGEEEQSKRKPARRVSLVLVEYLHFFLYEHRVLICVIFLAWACVFGAMMPKLQPNEDALTVLPPNSNLERMKVAQQEKLALCSLNKLYTMCSYRTTDSLVSLESSPQLSPWMLDSEVDLSVLDNVSKSTVAPLFAFTGTLFLLLAVFSLPYSYACWVAKRVDLSLPWRSTALVIRPPRICRESKVPAAVLTFMNLILLAFGILSLVRAAPPASDEGVVANPESDCRTDVVLCTGLGLVLLLTALQQLPFLHAWWAMQPLALDEWWPFAFVIGKRPIKDDGTMQLSRQQPASGRGNHADPTPIHELTLAPLMTQIEIKPPKWLRRKQARVYPQSLDSKANMRNRNAAFEDATTQLRGRGRARAVGDADRDAAHMGISAGYAVGADGTRYIQRLDSEWLTNDGAWKRPMEVWAYSLVTMGLAFLGLTIMLMPALAKLSGGVGSAGASDEYADGSAIDSAACQLALGVLGIVFSALLVPVVYTWWRGEEWGGMRPPAYMKWRLSDQIGNGHDVEQGRRFQRQFSRRDTAGHDDGDNGGENKNGEDDDERKTADDDDYGVGARGSRINESANSNARVKEMSKLIGLWLLLFIGGAIFIFAGITSAAGQMDGGGGSTIKKYGMFMGIFLIYIGLLGLPWFYPFWIRKRWLFLEPPAWVVRSRSRWPALVVYFVSMAFCASGMAMIYFSKYAGAAADNNDEGGSIGSNQMKPAGNDDGSGDGGGGSNGGSDADAAQIVVGVLLVVTSLLLLPLNYSWAIKQYVCCCEPPRFVKDKNSRLPAAMLHIVTLVLSVTGLYCVINGSADDEVTVANVSWRCTNEPSLFGICNATAAIGTSTNYAITTHQVIDEAAESFDIGRSSPAYAVPRSSFISATSNSSHYVTVAITDLPGYPFWHRTCEAICLDANGYDVELPPAAVTSKKEKGFSAAFMQLSIGVVLMFGGILLVPVAFSWMYLRPVAACITIPDWVYDSNSGMPALKLMFALSGIFVVGLILAATYGQHFEDNNSGSGDSSGGGGGGGSTSNGGSGGSGGNGGGDGKLDANTLELGFGVLLLVWSTVMMPSTYSLWTNNKPWKCLPVAAYAARPAWLVERRRQRTEHVARNGGQVSVLSSYYEVIVPVLNLLGFAMGVVLVCWSRIKDCSQHGCDFGNSGEDFIYADDDIVAEQQAVRRSDSANGSSNDDHVTLVIAGTVCLSVSVFAAMYVYVYAMKDCYLKQHTDGTLVKLGRYVQRMRRGTGFLVCALVAGSVLISARRFDHSSQLGLALFFAETTILCAILTFVCSTGRKFGKIPPPPSARRGRNSSWMRTITTYSVTAAAATIVSIIASALLFEKGLDGSMVGGASPSAGAVGVMAEDIDWTQFAASNHPPEHLSGVVTLLFGVSGVSGKDNSDPNSVGDPVFPSEEGGLDAWLRSPQVQNLLEGWCSKLPNYPIVHQNWNPNSDCVFTKWKASATAGEGSWPVSESEFAPSLGLTAEMKGRHPLDTMMGPKLQFTDAELAGGGGKDGALSRLGSESTSAYWEKLQTVGWVAIEVQSTFLDVDSGIVLQPYHHAWSAILNSIRHELAIAAGADAVEAADAVPAVLSAKAFVRMSVETEFQQGTVLACAITTACSVAAVLLFVQNLSITLLVLMTIVEMLALVGGALVLRGKGLGVVEAVSIAILIGMSVDYVIHLAHAFQHSVFTTRSSRGKSALLSRGGSVVSAAISTLGCCFVLLFCEIQIFPQFAEVVMITIAFSVVCSIGGFMPLVMILGPKKRKRLVDTRPEDATWHSR